MVGALHIPVLLDEMLENLSPKDGEVYVDGTFGAGGYSRAILKSADCKVYAIDRDPNVEKLAKELMKEFPGRLEFIQGNFGDVEKLLSDKGITKVDGIVLDVGVSSMQLDQAERGFSFSKDGPLDMRMSGEGQTACDIVNSFGEKELADIIYKFGDERKSRIIARAIVKAREERPIETTGQLSSIIHSVIRAGKSKIDVSTKTFQALRIWINDELGELEKALNAAENILAVGGRLVVISFHSLEDSIVKKFLKDKSQGDEIGNRHMPVVHGGEKQKIFRLIKRKAVKPGDEEISNNVRSRSSRLRAAIKIYQGDVK